MKKKQLAVWMCAGVMLMAAGCTKTTVAQSDAVETTSVEAGQETMPEDTKNRDVPSEEQAGDTENRKALSGEQAEDTENQDALSEEPSEASKLQAASDELEADVISVDYSNKFAVVNEIFTEAYDDGSSVAVLVGDGGDTAESITVYFMDDISYTLKIIKNGGADVTTSEADFSDIQEGDILDLKGKRAYSEKSGDEFLASEVTISRVILE